jgi:hypothetical protein
MGLALELSVRDYCIRTIASPLSQSLIQLPIQPLFSR